MDGHWPSRWVVRTVRFFPLYGTDYLALEIHPQMSQMYLFTAENAESAEMTERENLDQITESIISKIRGNVPKVSSKNRLCRSNLHPVGTSRDGVPLSPEY